MSPPGSALDSPWSTSRRRRSPTSPAALRAGCEPDRPTSASSVRAKRLASREVDTASPRRPSGSSPLRLPRLWCRASVFIALAACRREAPRCRCVRTLPEVAVPIGRRHSRRSRRRRSPAARRRRTPRRTRTPPSRGLAIIHSVFCFQVTPERPHGSSDLVPRLRLGFPCRIERSEGRVRGVRRSLLNMREHGRRHAIVDARRAGKFLRQSQGEVGRL